MAPTKKHGAKEEEEELIPVSVCRVALTEFVNEMQRTYYVKLAEWTRAHEENQC